MSPCTRCRVQERIAQRPEQYLLSQLLDQLLVLVQLAKVVSRHAGNAQVLALLNVLGVPEHAHRQTGTWVARQPDGAAETFVLDGVIVLQGNLKLDRLREASLLALRVLQDGVDGLLQGGAVNFAVRNTKRLLAWAGHDAFQDNTSL